jgi:hypothetical protein
VEQLKAAGVAEYEVYSPVLPHESLEPQMPRQGSRVRVLAAIGGVGGVVIGFGMCILSSLIYRLTTGGKPPVSLAPFVVVGFECTILFACLATVGSLVYFARLRPLAPPAEYRDCFSSDRYGLYVQCDPARQEAMVQLLQEAGAIEVMEGNSAHA